MVCCSPPSASSSTPLRPSVHHPSISLVENILYIRIFCDHRNVLYIFDHLYRFMSGWNSATRMPRLNVSPPSLSPSHPPTPPPSRWPALTTLPPLAKFQLVWRRFREALLFSSSPAGQKHLSLLLRLCLICRRYKGHFSLTMKIKSSIIFADIVDALIATFAV